MFIAQSHFLLVSLIALDPYPSFDVALKMPLETSRSFTFLRSGRIEDDDSIGLDKRPNVQYRDKNTCPPSENDGDQIRCKRIELAKVPGLL